MIKNTLKAAFTLLIILFFVNAEIYAQDNRNLINSYLKTEQVKNNWLAGDINDWVLSDQYTDKTTGLIHAYIQQRHHGIIVYNAISAFAIRENAVLSFAPGLIDHLETKVNADQPSITPEKALDLVLSYLKKDKQGTANLLSTDAASHKFIFELPEISSSPVKVQLVYRKAEERVLLAWDVSIEMKDEPHWWNIRVDARTGKFIDKNDYTAQDTYDVFAYPLEAPSFGSRSLLSNPSDVIASPYKWHDVNGAAGAEYTITRGNNVYAYEDANNDNIPGYSPNGGASLVFDFPIVANTTPATNQDASLTNLFYDNNAIHDFLYRLGFDEVAGNFQQNNYGRGGIGGDYVKAEGFDGSGTNNANFSTPPDGGSGRMQMYLWNGSGAGCSSLNISSSTFTGSMTIAVAEFSSIGIVTANLILAIDATSPVNDACSPITNNVSGKIVLIDRGLCNFINKAQAAQAAGAVGVIIANNVSGGAPAMGGSPPVSIPCVSISQADGNTLKSALLAGTVSATIVTCNTNQIDGSFDNGVVAHEYGHGVSNRLTGGPSQASCLANGEQGGEGWSDWLALMMTIEAGDAGTDARGIGTYVKGQPTNGSGIRRYPYSTNMSINPQTYGNLALNPEVHAIGEIWCDAIWDMSWFLINQYGFSSTFSQSSGNYIAMRLVLEGMKLQPCGPGFLDARDAILTADALIYNNAHRCLIWQAFARRGMGYNAVQGSADVAGDETEGFSLPPYCSSPTQPPVAAFTSDVSTVMCGGKVHFTDQSVQAFNWSWNFGDQGTSILQNPVHTFTAPGTYNVKLVVTNPLGSDSVVHAITVSPAFTANVTATPSAICSGDSVQLNAVASGSTYRSYLVSGIGYAPLPDTGTAVSLGDDQVSSAKSIGFNFNFFGTSYSNFYICSNGFITFTANMPAPYYSSPVPQTGTPDNFISLAWNDLNPQNAGSYIKYYTIGSAPNRKLVVSFHTSHYGGTQYPFIVQAILYETSNLVEIHTTTISDPSAYDPEARTTQGLENADGSGGVAVPGRNSTIFSASNDAYRFTQYVPYSYNWLPGNLGGPTQTVHPPSTGTYAVQISDGTACLATFNTPVITVNSCNALLNLKVFIEGLYLDNDMMQAVLYDREMSTDPTASDSITVEFHNTTQPYSTVAAVSTLLHTNGTATVVVPGSLVNHFYYLALRYKNAIETWSKVPVLVTSPNFSFDLTRP